jgi:hypothetical protein
VVNILALVGRSADTAVTLSTIAERARVSRREVEQAIQEARLHGHPLITSAKGAWLGTDAEALEWCERARSRVLHQLETIKAVEGGVVARRADQPTLGLVA